MIIKKKLITDISSEEIRRVTELLKANDISYDMKTVTSRISNSKKDHKLMEMTLEIIFNLE